MHGEGLTHVTHASLGWIPFFPLLGALLAYTIGQKAKDMAGWIATGASTLSFLTVVYFFFSLPAAGYFEHNLFEWISVSGFHADFLFRFDQLTAVMCLVVTGIGSLIHLYSVGYMAEDESRPRFFAYLNLFLFSMLLLVLGGNMLILFIGWEGVGLCSYLLIGFWHKNIAFAGAGRKAFVVNRIGDAGFLLATFLVVMHFGTIDFVELKGLIAGHSEALMTTIALCLFLGATGKSAQIPLFVWLPDAMAGPTPVSALIHAATMVTAGVYLMARMHYVFDPALAPVAMLVVCTIAVLTAFVAACVALVQNDIKKVLAYSTVSQLGFMFMAAGAGAYWVAVFHLVTHAFFKACLFLGSGSVIHACHHEQDMRQMGGLGKIMPWTAATYWISTIAIAGIYPLAGYFSKHHIVVALGDAGMSNPSIAAWDTFFGVVATLAAIMTAFYVTRSACMTFLGEYRGHAHPHESPITMVAPLVVLAALAFFGGWLLEGPLSLHHYLGAVIPVGEGGHGESIIASLLHSWPGFLGVGLGVVFYTKLTVIPQTLSKTLPQLTQILSDKFYFDEIYNALVVSPLQKGAHLLWKKADQAGIDGAVNGTAAVVDVSGEIARTVSTGQMRHYALFMFIGTVFLFLFYLVL